MVARTAGTVTLLTRDASGVVPTVNNAATAGFYVPGASTDLRKILIRVVNGTTAGTMTIRAPGNGVDAAGNSQVSPYPSSAVFAQGATGDVLVTWSTTAGTLVVGPLTSDRFMQPDGNMYLDFSTATAVTFEIQQLPYNVV